MAQVVVWVPEQKMKISQLNMIDPKQFFHWLGASLDHFQHIFIGAHPLDEPESTLIFNSGDSEQLVQIVRYIMTQQRLWRFDVYSDFRDLSKESYLLKLFNRENFELRVASILFNPMDFAGEQLRVIEPPLDMIETYPEYSVSEDDAVTTLDSLYTLHRQQVGDFFAEKPNSK